MTLFSLANMIQWYRKIIYLCPTDLLPSSMWLDYPGDLVTSSQCPSTCLDAYDSLNHHPLTSVWTSNQDCLKRCFPETWEHQIFLYKISPPEMSSNFTFLLNMVLLTQSVLKLKKKKTTAGSVYCLNVNLITMSFLERWEEPGNHT